MRVRPWDTRMAGRMSLAGLILPSVLIGRREPRTELA
jgi:hypothetical protein